MGGYCSGCGLRRRVIKKNSIGGIRTHALSADDLKSPPLTARARYFDNHLFFPPHFNWNVIFIIYIIWINSYTIIVQIHSHSLSQCCSHSSSLIMRTILSNPSSISAKYQICIFTDIQIKIVHFYFSTSFMTDFLVLFSSFSRPYALLSLQHYSLPKTRDHYQQHSWVNLHCFHRWGSASFKPSNDSSRRKDTCIKLSGITTSNSPHWQITALPENLTVDRLRAPERPYYLQTAI